MPFSVKLAYQHYESFTILYTIVVGRGFGCELHLFILNVIVNRLPHVVHNVFHNKRQTVKNGFSFEQIGVAVVF